MIRRLRTRLFAAQCILELPHDVGSDPRHFDLEAAQDPASSAGAARASRHPSPAERRLTGCAAAPLIRDATMNIHQEQPGEWLGFLRFLLTLGRPLTGRLWAQVVRHVSPRPQGTGW